jgi:Tol biopolymer transport system component
VLSNQGTAAIQWQAGSGSTEIRLIDLETREVTSLFSSEAISWLVPRDFSADGESLAVHYQENDGVRLGILSVRDASLRPLVSTAWSPWTTMFFSPGGEYIAYDLPAAGFQSLRDVFIVSTDGSSRRPVTSHPADDRLVGWAPDGRSLLYASEREGRMPLFEVRISDGRLAYRRGSMGGVAVRNMATGEETVLTRATTFAIAPDGRRLAFVERGDEDVRRIMVSAFDGEPRRVHEILPAGTSPLGFLRWTADGARIIFGRWIDDRPVPTAFSVPVSGGPATEFDSRIPGHSSLAIHPDGRAVAFETLDSRTEIWAYDGVIPGISAGGR